MVTTPKVMRLFLTIFALVLCLSAAAAFNYHNGPDETWASEKYIWLLKSLISRAAAASAWRNTDMHVFHEEDKPFKQRKHSGVSQMDVMSSTILLKRLLDIRHKFNIGALDLGDSLQQGHKCSEAETQKQQAYVKKEKPNACAEIEAYKLAHLAWPAASVIIDIGTDRGYRSALFMSLWAGGGHGVNPRSLLHSVQQNRAWTKAENLRLAGHCKTGLNRGYPLVCDVHSREEDGKCNESYSDIRIYSTHDDGQKVGTLQSDVIAKQYRDTFGDSLVWDISLLDIPGKILSLNSSESRPATADAVNTFIKDRNIPEDMDIIRIAAQAVSYEAVWAFLGLLERGHKIGMITFPNLGYENTGELANLLSHLQQFHFDCYVPYFIGFIKLTGGCWPNVGQLNLGNIFCASRMRAPGVVMVYDSLMLGHLDNYYWPY